MTFMVSMPLYDKCLHLIRARGPLPVSHDGRFLTGLHTCSGNFRIYMCCWLVPTSNARCSNFGNTELRVERMITWCVACLVARCRKKAVESL